MHFAVSLIAALHIVSAGGAAWFTDVTGQSGIPALKYSEGVNFRDLDGDGLPELFLPNVKGKDRLFKNLGGCRFREITGEAGIREKDGIGALIADFDRDGLADIYVVRGAYPYGVNVMYRQSAPGRFEDVTKSAGVEGRKNGIGAAAGDMDGDGLPDIFVSNWGADTLYKNISRPGVLAFRDVSSEAGLTGEGRSWGAVIADFTGDGMPDVFVSRGGFGRPERQRLYANRGGAFEDKKDAGLDGVSWSMGAAASDMDGDGDMDIFVGNYDGPDRIYANDGRGRFTDITDTSGITSGHTVGSAAGDIDGDLLPDLAVAGYAGPVRIYKNLGGMRFAEVKGSGVGAYRKNEGMALADADGDGDLDLYVANYDGHNRLYRNNMGGENFLKVVPMDGKAPVVGAVARLYKTGGMGRRDALLASQTLQCGYGFCSQSPPEFLFALPGEGPYELEITFPGGKVVRMDEVKPGTIMVMKPEK